MAAVLGTFGTAIWLRSLSGQPLSLVILAAVLTLSLSRQPRSAHGSHVVISVAVVPAVALCAGSIGHLLLTDPDVGVALFIAVMSASMWLRQFGPLVARTASLLSLPVTSILVVPGAGLDTSPHTPWWQMAVALVALLWVQAVRTVASRLHRLPADQPRPPAAPRQPGRGPRGHTRLALQLAVSLTSAYVVGRVLFPGHWNWTLLTATIVCSGGPSRGEVVMKGAARLVGAAVGTVVASWLATLFPGHDGVAVVAIFVLLFLAAWWREIVYAVWAGSVTCVMALLNTYLGTPNTASLLGTRLEAIGVGALCAVVSCAVILPVATSSIVRRHRGSSLQAMGEVLHCMVEDPPALSAALVVLDARTADARRAVRSLRVRRMLFGHGGSVAHDLVSTIDALAACRRPLHELVAQAGGHRDASWDRALRTTIRNVGRTRQRVAGTAFADLEPVHDVRVADLDQAIRRITADRALDGSDGNDGAAERVSQSGQQAPQ
jgi:uncharacterized membrane protein YccC